MRHPRLALLAICVLIGALAPGGAHAQADKFDKPIDLKPLIPPVFQLPPNAQMNPGSVGGTQTPYSGSPPPGVTQTPTQPNPGIKLFIPSR
jgi:hypothetical protein